MMQSGKGRILLRAVPRPLLAGAFFRPWLHRTNLWHRRTNLRTGSDRLTGVGPPVMAQRMLRSLLARSLVVPACSRMGGTNEEAATRHDACDCKLSGARANHAIRTMASRHWKPGWGSLEA